MPNPKRGFNGTETVIDIPGSGSAYLAILATGPVRYVKFIESLFTKEGVANVPQGLFMLIPNDNTDATAPVPGVNPLGFNQPINIPVGNVGELGDPMSLARAEGSILGNGPNVNIGVGVTPAAVLCYLRSATATPTAITIAQYY